MVGAKWNRICSDDEDAEVFEGDDGLGDGIAPGPAGAVVLTSEGTGLSGRLT